MLVISDAEKMTTGASNALLKTLEDLGKLITCVVIATNLAATGYDSLAMSDLAFTALKAASSIDHLRAAGVDVPSDISTNDRALERLVLSVVDGKAGALDRDEHG